MARSERREARHPYPRKSDPGTDLPVRRPARPGRSRAVPQVLRSGALAASARPQAPATRPRDAARDVPLRPSPPSEGRSRLTVSISAVVLLGLLVYLLWRYADLRLWQATICVVFGYLLASSSLGPYLNSGLLVTLHLVSRLHV